jgi:hypothetical protein
VVGVISTETDQAVFPFGKANSIAATNCGTTAALLATGIPGARVLDSRPAASIMRPALDTKGAFGYQELTNGNEPNVSRGVEESLPDFLSSELNTHL